MFVVYLTKMGTRLMVGQRTLDPPVEVRIPRSQPYIKNLTWIMRTQDCDGVNIIASVREIITLSLYLWLIYKFFYFTV